MDWKPLHQRFVQFVGRPAICKFLRQLNVVAASVGCVLSMPSRNCVCSVGCENMTCNGNGVEPGDPCTECGAPLADEHDQLSKQMCDGCLSQNAPFNLFSDSVVYDDTLWWD